VRFLWKHRTSLANGGDIVTPIEAEARTLLAATRRRRPTVAERITLAQVETDLKLAKWAQRLDRAKFKDWAKCQWDRGILNPGLWEFLQGFPPGWTEPPSNFVSRAAATRSSLRSASGSASRSSPPTGASEGSTEMTVANELTPTPDDWLRYCEPVNWHDASLDDPVMDGERLAALAEDVRARGLLEPVVLYEAKVLDGRNRLLACRMAKVAPRFATWSPSDGVTPHEFVASRNLHRRHLTREQWVARIRKLAERITQEVQVAPSRGGRPRKTGPDEPVSVFWLISGISERELHRRLSNATGKSRATIRRALSKGKPRGRLLRLRSAVNSFLRSLEALSQFEGDFGHLWVMMDHTLAHRVEEEAPRAIDILGKLLETARGPNQGG
jgi:hypothetical protein